MIKLFIYIIIILSSVIHEYAHGWAAYQQGDSTAKDAGRLTLNPLRHLDPFGTIILPLILLFTSNIFIGWAKPVPYNPYNLKDQKFGTLKVAAAGPGINLIIALILGLVLRFLFPVIYQINYYLPTFISFIVYVNIVLALFNLIPFPPLDGSKIISDIFPGFGKRLLQLNFLGIALALFIAFSVLPTIANFIFKIIVGQYFS
jgi:Zn-dependent protease